MRSKLLSGALVVTLGFLVATNPVVVNAAGQITSGQIKNETIKSKDIKNNQIKSTDIKDGAVQSADLAPGTGTVKSVKRFLGGGGTIAESADLAFYGTTTSVTVDGNDLLVANGTLDWYATVAGDDFYYSLCARPTGSGGTPAPIGGSTAISADIDVVNGDGSVSRSVSGVLAAGSYDVGMCVRASTANTGSMQSFGAPGGWAMVIDGSGPLGRVGPAAPAKANNQG